MKLTKIVIMGALAVALAGCEGNPFARKNEPIEIRNTTTTTGVIPGSAQDPTSAAFFQQNVGDRVLFLVNESSLTPQATAILDGQANWLMANPSFNVTVEGHADEQGTREYNLALGARRASAVKNYLGSRGVPESRLGTITYGKERPLEVCSTEECWSKNRRAVTVVTSGFSS